MKNLKYFYASLIIAFFTSTCFSLPVTHASNQKLASRFAKITEKVNSILQKSPDKAIPIYELLYTIRNRPWKNYSSDIHLHFSQLMKSIEKVIAYRLRTMENGINWSYYSKNDQHVYWQKVILNGSAPEDFFVFESDNNYAKDNTHAYYQWKIIPDVNIDSFQAFTGGLSKDEDTIYFKIFPISWVDLESFEVFNKNYAKDKNHVYKIIRWLIVLPNYDTSSFKALSDKYTIDKSWVYYDDELLPKINKNNFSVTSEGYGKTSFWLYRWKIYLGPIDPTEYPVIYSDYSRKIYTYWDSIILNFTEIPEIKSEWIKVMGRCENYVILKNKQHVYYLLWENKIKKLDADAESFSTFSLSRCIAKDKNHVYRYNSSTRKLYTVEWVDWSTFELVNEYYWKDANHIVRFDYDWEFLLSWPDSKPFEIINSAYAKDKDTVYFGRNKTSDFDAKTLKRANSYIFFDKNYAYHWFSKVKVDYQSFYCISNVYCKDKNKVIYFWKREPTDKSTWFEISWAHIPSFETIWENIWRDKQHVFFAKQKVNWADPGSIKILFANGRHFTYYYKDKNSVYINSEKISSNPDSFKVLNIYYSKDKNKAYYRWKELIGADPDTFEVYLENWRTYWEAFDFSKSPYLRYAKDKNQVYIWWITKKIPEINGFSYRDISVSIKDADPKTFIPLSYCFSKDNNNAYTHKVEIPEVDSFTFNNWDCGGWYDINNANSHFDTMTRKYDKQKENLISQGRSGILFYADDRVMYPEDRSPIYYHLDISE